MTPRPPRIYYGWVIVTVAFVCGSFTAGLAIWSPSVFVVPMRAELGWSLTDYFLGFTIRAVAAAALAPIIGPWLDTARGPRVLAVISVLGMSLSLAGLKYIGEIPAFDFLGTRLQFYLIFGGLGAVGWMASGFIIAQAVLPKWFIAKRGRAMGIAAVGTGFGPMLFPLMTQGLISGVGWRDAWLALGVISLVVQLPFALLVRGRPEDMGLYPDGAAGPEGAPRRAPVGGRARVPERSLTRGEALRTKTYWMLVASIMVAGIGFMGFQPSWVPYLQEKGFSAAVAVAGVSVYGAFSGSARLIWGALAERHSVRRLLVIETMITGFTVFILIYVVNTPMVMAFMVTAGLTMGGYFILQPMLIAEYFGRQHLGAVSGAIAPFMTLSGAVAPILVSTLRDSQGDYFLAFLLAMGAWYGTSIIVFFTRAPKPKAPVAMKVPAPGG